MQSIRELKEILEANSNTENAKGAEAYMKNLFKYYGIKQPLRKKLSGKFISENSKHSDVEMEKLIKELWIMPMREFKYVAIDMLDRYCKKASGNTVDLYEHLIVTESWWDTVDMIAQKHLGIHFQRFPDQLLPYTNKWIDSDNMWLQRTAILFQNRYKENTDKDLLFKYIIKHSGSTEFFIQKAIGWALRQYADTNPDAVRDFVLKNDLAPLSKKEALRKINKK